ncbi:hypothetical protein BBJ28_00010519 [Nothophytophthora sp. Chile5]|nr:hypothetical protein BBJ28_00010519 [Nothophytophthora sp. Chile5]
MVPFQMENEFAERSLSFLDDVVDAACLAPQEHPPEAEGELLSLDDDPEVTRLLNSLTTGLDALAGDDEGAETPQTLALETMPVVCLSPAVSLPLASTEPSQIERKKYGRKKRLSYNPNKARDERKLELAYLRNEVTEMELKLQQLQTVKDYRDSSGAGSGALTSGGTGDERQALASSNEGRMPFVWEQTCAGQLERRLRAERENIRLKMVLETQIQIAKSMERLLNKRTALRATETSGSSQSTRRVHVSQGGNVVADALMIEELQAGVEASYRNVDAVFEANGLRYTQVPTRVAQMRDGVKGMYMEISDNKIMPFDMHATGEAWWHHWHHYRSGRDLETTEDTIVERYGLEMSDSKTNTTARFHVQQVLRRYVEEHHIVVVWQAYIEPLEFSSKRFAGIVFREKGYVVIKPRHSDSTTGEDKSYTLVQTLYTITPDLSDQRLNDDSKTGALTEFVMSATAAHISVSNETIENSLVDQALQGRCRANTVRGRQ